jgi:hypothetical protein
MKSKVFVLIASTLTIYFTLANARPINYIAKTNNSPDRSSVAAAITNRISDKVYEEASEGLQTLIGKGIITNDSILAIADFSKPSNEKRLFLINLCTQEVIFETLVAHGKKSGTSTANFISNKANSNMSSAGFFKTAETYQGKHGTSLKLEGLEKGINDNALARGIVVHGADYVNEKWANEKGWIGRSLGCPAVPTSDIKKVIQLLPTGTCLFIYHPVC